MSVGSELLGRLLWVPGGAAALGPLEPDLADVYWQWEQDPAVLSGLGRQTFPSQEERKKVYESHTKGTENDLHFTVYDMTSGEPRACGLTGVTVDHRRRTGMLFIHLGMEASRGHGVGTEAARLVLDAAFHVTGLSCVWLSAFAPNVRAIAAYEKAGFRHVGRRRQSAYWLGQRVDEVLMDAIPEEFVGASAVRARVMGGMDGR